MKVVLNILQDAWGKANDLLLGIETNGRSAKPENGKLRTLNNDDMPYQAADYRNLRRIVRMVQPTDNDVIYDIGCGKGRCVALFARRKVHRVVGIDFDPLLCSVARRNADRLRGRRSPIEIRCEDAASTDLSDGTVYFLYNPFGVETLKTVFRCITNSLEEKPRAIRVVYYNALFESVLSSFSCLQRVSYFKTLTRRRVSLWRNLALLSLQLLDWMDYFELGSVVTI